MTVKSPFYIVQHFLSPLRCEEIIDTMGYTIPDVDKDDAPIHSKRQNEIAEAIIYEQYRPLVPTLERYYEIEGYGTERMWFEWFPEESCGGISCENSIRSQKKWARVRNRDLSFILFLSDYQDQTPFDADFEVYGGKLEFPQHQFSFQPQRGTLIIFPSGPHFINITSKVLVGDLHQVRWHLAAKQPFMYDPSKFPGDYTSWFKNID